MSSWFIQNLAQPLWSCPKSQLRTNVIDGGFPAFEADLLTDWYAVHLQQGVVENMGEFWE